MGMALRKVVIEGMMAADKPCPQLQPSLGLTRLCFFKFKLGDSNISFHNKIGFKDVLSCTSYGTVLE